MALISCYGVCVCVCVCTRVCACVCLCVCVCTRVCVCVWCVSPGVSRRWSVAIAPRHCVHLHTHTHTHLPPRWRPANEFGCRERLTGDHILSSGHSTPPFSHSYTSSSSNRTSFELLDFFLSCFVSNFPFVCFSRRRQRDGGALTGGRDRLSLL